MSIDTNVATSDSTNGWVMGGERKENGYRDREYLLKKTRDGSSFEPFPSLPERYGRAICLETLDNGGDIFAASDIYDGNIYIFRHTNSTTAMSTTTTTSPVTTTNPGNLGTSAWERQPGVPMDTDDQSKLHNYKTREK